MSAYMWPHTAQFTPFKVLLFEMPACLFGGGVTGVFAGISFFLPSPAPVLWVKGLLPE